MRRAAGRGAKGVERGVIAELFRGGRLGGLYLQIEFVAPGENVTRAFERCDARLLQGGLETRFRGGECVGEILRLARAGANLEPAPAGEREIE